MPSSFRTAHHGTHGEHVASEPSPHLLKLHVQGAQHNLIILSICIFSHAYCTEADICQPCHHSGSVTALSRPSHEPDLPKSGGMSRNTTPGERSRDLPTFPSHYCPQRRLFTEPASNTSTRHRAAQQLFHSHFVTASDKRSPFST